MLVIAFVAAFSAFALIALRRPAGNLPLPDTNSPAACRDFTQGSLSVDNNTLSVAIAATPAQRAQGLAGCAEVHQGSGMYFTFDQPIEAEFWMKGMLMPIDIIWIREGKVVGIDKNVPPPTAGQADDVLPLYPAPQPVSAVLELAAGEAERLQIDSSTLVLLQ